MLALLWLILFTTFNNLVGGIYMALLDPYGLSLVSVEVWGLLCGVLGVGFLAGGAIIGKFGLEEADKAVPGWTVSGLESAAQQEVADAQAEAGAGDAGDVYPQSAFAENSEHSMTQEEIDRLKAENAALRKQAADAAKKQAHDANVAFAEGLVTAGKLAPAGKDVAVAMLDLIGTQPEAVQFGEGDAKQPLGDAFKAWLSGQPVAAEFAEVATKGRAADAVGTSAQYAEGADPARIALDRKARAYARERSVSYAEAVNAVIAAS